MSGLDNLIDAIQLVLETNNNTVNTSVPGTIVSYDPATNRAKVKPLLPKKLANGQVLPAPEIVQVPVIFPASGMGEGGKQAGITLPVTAGDGVMLSFQQRSIENWLSGNDSAPDDPRKFDLSDAVATPGLNNKGFAGNGTDVVIRMDKASITLKPDNTVVFGNENASITLSPDGTIALKGTSVTIDAGGKNFVLETHKHLDVEPGGGISGEPQG
jgi:hypothetical protein